MQATLDTSCHARLGQLVLTGEIDLSNAADYTAVVAAVIRSSRGLPHISLDLSGVTFMDCQGVTMLMAIRQLARAAGVCVTLEAVAAPVSRVLTLTGVDAFFSTNLSGSPSRCRPVHVSRHAGT